MTQIASCLIVDDDASWRKLLAIYVDQISPGVTIRVCASLEEGLEQLQRASWTVLLLDLGLPRMSVRPPQALERVIEAHPEQPIVVVSGSTDVDDTGIHIDLLRYGAVDAISKCSVSREHLAQAIRLALQRAARKSGVAYRAVDTLEAAIKDYEGDNS